MSSGIQFGAPRPRKLQPGFFWIDNEIVDEYASKVDALSLAVYAVLCRVANNETGRCHRVPHQRIATLLALSVSTVKRRLKCLERAGLIRVLPNDTYEACDFELLQITKRIQPSAKKHADKTPVAKAVHKELPGVPSEPQAVLTDRSNKEDNIHQHSIAKYCGGGEDERLGAVRQYIQEVLCHCEQD